MSVSVGKNTCTTEMPQHTDAAPNRCQSTCVAFLPSGALRVQHLRQARLACHRVQSEGDSADVPAYDAAPLHSCVPE